MPSVLSRGCTGRGGNKERRQGVGWHETKTTTAPQSPQTHTHHPGLHIPPMHQALKVGFHRALRALSGALSQGSSAARLQPLPVATGPQLLLQGVDHSAAHVRHQAAHIQGRDCAWWVGVGLGLGLPTFREDTVHGG
jgi:hypothetical protein